MSPYCRLPVTSVVAACSGVDGTKRAVGAHATSDSLAADRVFPSSVVVAVADFVGSIAAVPGAVWQPAEID